MRILKILVAALLLAVAGVGLAGYEAYQRAHAPFRGFEDEEIFFTVSRGATASSIGRELEANGIIEDARLFVATLRLNGEAAKLQAGEYRFAAPASVVDVARRLVDGDVYTFQVTVPEGLTVAETAAHLASLGLGTAEELEDAFLDPALAARLGKDAGGVEGYLFPTTYQFTRNPTPQQIARAMVSQFESMFDDGRRERSEAMGLSRHEVITLASVVEKETGSAEERPLVASVFWNRLKRGMPLASDPTIIYAKKIAGTFDGNLRRVDLELDSPYNTYRVAGIPPGPIASPGEAAIDAVLDPPDTDYLFFVSKNDGTSHFSTNFREHANAVQKYQVEYFRNRRRRRNQEGGSS